MKNRLVFFTAFIVFCSIIFVSHYESLFSKQSVRTIHIKVLTDRALRFYSGWEKFIEKITKEASAEFNRQLGIKLKIKKFEEMETFRDARDGTHHKEWNELNRLADDINPENCDIIICFSGELCRTYAGSANEILGRLILLVRLKEFSYEQMRCVFIHEVGHLFGAKHTNNPHSVMYTGAGMYCALEFDRDSKEIILKNKWRNFKEK